MQRTCRVRVCNSLVEWLAEARKCSQLLQEYEGTSFDMCRAKKCEGASGFNGSGGDHASSAGSRASRCSFAGARRRALMNQLETYQVSATVLEWWACASRSSDCWDGEDSDSRRAPNDTLKDETSRARGIG
jgi:hypothetical protein